LKKLAFFLALIVFCLSLLNLLISGFHLISFIALLATLATLIKYGSDAFQKKKESDDKIYQKQKVSGKSTAYQAGRDINNK